MVRTAVGVLFAAALVSASTASAEIVNGALFLDPTPPDLTTGCTLPCPYANITVDLQTSTKAVITVEALSNPAGFTYMLAGVGNGGGPPGNLFGLALQDLGGTLPTISVTNITTTYLIGNCAATDAPNGDCVHWVPGEDQMDGAGDYNVILTWGDDASHGSTAGLSKLVFTINNLSGTWDCVREVGLNSCGASSLLDNNENFKLLWTNSITGQSPFPSTSWAAGHLSRCETSSLPSSCGQTGVVTAWAGGAAITASVSEPAIITLLGSGLLLAGALARRFRK